MRCYNCSGRFMDGEDFRDHLPCETEIQRIKARVKELEGLLSRVLCASFHVYTEVQGEIKGDIRKALKSRQ